MPVTLGEIARVIGAELRGDPDHIIINVATLQNAKAGSLSFLANRRYYSFLLQTSASAVVLGKPDAESCPVAALVTEDPYLGFVKAVRYLNPEPEFKPHIHPSAVIHDSVVVPESCFIGPNTVLGMDTELSKHVYIGPGSVLENGVVIGQGSRLLANVTLCRGVTIGKRNILHPGVVIGADGFGIANDGGTWLKIPQLGSVIIGDDVEIGANTTIDRGALEHTIIENGVKIDNQVQIGHNARIGEHTAIAGQVAIAGSASIGKRCMIGGASAISGHIDIADDVVITGMSGVPNSIKRAGIYSAGLPVTENLKWRKNIARFKNLDEMARKLAKLVEKADKNGES